MRDATEFQAQHEPCSTTDSSATINIQTEPSTNENCRTSPAVGPVASEEYSALVARATHDAVRDWDVAAGRLTWPQGLETLLGFDPASVPPKISFWQQRVHPDDRSRVAAAIRDALGSGDSWSGEYRFQLANGSYALLLERAAIVRDDSGRAVRFVGSLMDVTARKELQDQLCRSQKMEAFGKLAGGVAHDFNNFLTTILGYSDLLLDELRVKGHLASHITEIRKAAARASTLAGQLLAFSRKHPLEPRVVEVNALLANLERSILRLIGENITVECRLPRAKDGIHIRVDPGQLTQIMVNLVVNARDAMPGGGHLIVGAQNVRFEQPHLTHGTSALAPGEYVAITIRDNGVGMSDDVKAHLFEPFFTTKEHAQGSGLGLATSYGIVRQSGGQIEVESEIGTGTSVTLYFPTVRPPEAARQRKPSRSLPAGRETVLVLEDDVSVRHLSVRVLTSLGYKVIEAASGDDAQRLVADGNGARIDLLLTDVVMPQMSGRDFAQWMRKSSPHTKIVFISGYLQESLSSLNMRESGMFFLPKPFDPEQLAKKVREALDPATPAPA